MNYNRMFNRFIITFLEKYGFKLHDKKDGTYVFKHIDDSEIRIIFNISMKKKSIFVDICREYEVNWPGYNLQLFLEDPAFAEKPIDEAWYFDTEEDFVGALEEQAELLKDKGFDWLHNCSNYDLKKIVTDRANEKAEIWQRSTQAEREQSVNELRALRNKWKQRRVKPVIWLNEK